MAMSSWTRSRRRLPRSRPCTASGSPTICADPAPRVRASRTDPGRPSGPRGAPAAGRRADRSVMSWPSKTIFPSVTGCSRAMQRASVDLPQPVSPTSPSVSPSRIRRLTPSTAWTNRCSRARRPAFRMREVLDDSGQLQQGGRGVGRGGVAAAPAVASSRRRPGPGGRISPATASGSQQADTWPGLVPDGRSGGALGGAPVEGEAAARRERAARRLDAACSAAGREWAAAGRCRRPPGSTPAARACRGGAPGSRPSAGRPAPPAGRCT